MNKQFEEMEEALRQETQAAKAQSAAAIDQAVQRETEKLQKAQSEAQAQFQAQSRSIDLEEALGKDNQALYAEIRGDRGGIGAAQYDSIMNTAAENRRALRLAQTNLAAETARNMASLRAQGEYEKADKALALTQEYLGKLQELREWSEEQRLSQEKFQESIRQWQAEYDAKAAQTAAEAARKDQEFVYKTQQADLKEAGQALLKAGVLPSEGQLTAMGMDRAQAQAYLAAQAKSAANKGSTSGSSAGKGSGSGSAAGSGSGQGAAGAKQGGEYALYLAARRSGGSPRTYVKSHYQEYGLTALPSEGAYKAWEASIPEPLGSRAETQLLGKVRISLSEDSKSATDYMVDKYWPALTEAQQEKVLEVYAEFGKSYLYGD